MTTDELDLTLDRIRGFARPGALGCLRDTASLHAALAELARPETYVKGRVEVPEGEIDREYWRLRRQDPDGPRCRRMEPDADATCDPTCHAGDAA